MVEKVESYKSNSGKLFLSEENAVRHDAIERLCEVMPEFQMIRVRLEGQLDAIASAVAPMVDFRRRKTTPETTPKTTLTTSATPGQVAEVKQVYIDDQPVADVRRCPYNHPDDSRCPNCADWEGYVHRRPVRAVNG